MSRRKNQKPTVNELGNTVEVGGKFTEVALDKQGDNGIVTILYAGQKVATINTDAQTIDNAINAAPSSVVNQVSANHADFVGDIKVILNPDSNMITIFNGTQQIAAFPGSGTSIGDAISSIPANIQSIQVDHSTSDSLHDAGKSIESAVKGVRDAIQGSDTTIDTTTTPPQPVVSNSDATAAQQAIASNPVLQTTVNSIPEDLKQSVAATVPSDSISTDEAVKTALHPDANYETTSQVDSL